MDDKKPRMADPEINRGAIKVLFAFGGIMLITMVFVVCRNLASSPDRYPGARAENRGSPPSLVEARCAQAAGPPPPVLVRDPVPGVSVLPPEHPDRKLLDAIRIKEGYRGDRKVGPRGERGPYQITEAYWKDACEYGHIDWNSNEWWYETQVYDVDKCEFIFWLYMLRHLGPHASDYRKARAHNSGPEDGQDLRAHAYAKEVLNIKMGMKGD